MRFDNFLGEKRAIYGVISYLEAIKCVAFNIFMKRATLFRIYPPSSLKMTKKKKKKKKKKEEKKKKKKIKKKKNKIKKKKN